MARINLAILWHMHQPQYRDPGTGRYLLPWTRLHALKDYWGMVKILEEFPRVRMTFNFVPLLAEQIEEYASGHFKEDWFEIAFAPAESLTDDQKARGSGAGVSSQRASAESLAPICGPRGAGALRRAGGLRRALECPRLA